MYTVSARMVEAIVEDDELRNKVNGFIPEAVGSAVSLAKGPIAGRVARAATNLVVEEAPKATAVLCGSILAGTALSAASMALIVAGPPAFLFWGVKKLLGA